MNYSETIRSEMGRRNLTTDRLAKISGVSRPLVADARNGKAKSIETLQRLADALNVPLELRIVPSTQLNMESNLPEAGLNS